MLWFNRALEIRKSIGDQLGVAKTLFRMGKVALAQDDKDRAMELFIQSRDQCGILGIEKFKSKAEEMISGLLSHHSL